MYLIVHGKRKLYVADNTHFSLVLLRLKKRNNRPKVNIVRHILYKNFS